MSNNTNSRISEKSREERIKLMLQREQEGHACPNCMPCTCNICMRCGGFSPTCFNVCDNCLIVEKPQNYTCYVSLYDEFRQIKMDELLASGQLLQTKND
jgi:hypothetical protein